ncbi:amidohydrolase [Paracoccus sp. 11-3]|uniref:Amidohydrolase n=1 Tax=Paracoccus amoyensis TaxID=2760093 RepID=A0A926JD04_9RHOB|nr:amidohydrolase [Paracoccus amoyensis]MBC9247465.1 amidohydrolase [Paracoccus amoyensis]
MAKMAAKVFAALFALVPASVLAAGPELVLYNGQLITLDDAQPQASAIAISDGVIQQIGDDATIRALASQDTRQIDMGGRTVIPGLTDGHSHLIRGGQSFTSETFWLDETSLASALEKLTAAAKDRNPDEWVVVAGSWIPEQFDEKRGPTPEELTAAVPDHPAYVQLLYDDAWVNARGIDVLRLNSPDPAVPPSITVERDAEGRATGRLLGGVFPYNMLLPQLLPQDPERRKESLRTFFATLNSYGVTGFVDATAGGPENYQMPFDLDRAGELNLRVSYRIPGLDPGHEPEWIARFMAFRQPHYEAGRIGFVGLGEALVGEMYDGVQMGPGFTSPPPAHERLRMIGDFAAERGIPLEFHAYTDDAAAAILDVFEDVNTRHSIRDLRWSLAHLNTGSERTLQRMADLGLAYSVQMGPYFEAPGILAANGPEVAAKSPPLRAALDKGLMVVGGTDSTRIGVYGVWQAIEYHVTGTSLGGVVQKSDDQLLTREEALRLYTSNAAWMNFAEERRGTLSPGKQADLAVLDQPYLTMPADRIDTIRADLTLIDGEIVHDVLTQGQQ